VLYSSSVTCSSQVTTCPLLSASLDGDVRHVAVGGCAVPVLLAGFDVDDVTGSDLRDAAIPRRDDADAVGDVEGLTLGVVVPGGASAGG
jgi:hypothetical protein